MKLEICAGEIDLENTKILQGIKKPKARNSGDLNSAIQSAAFYAKKHNETMFVYAGNSYMRAVWRVSCKKAEFLCSVNNTGNILYSVSPDRVLRKHNVTRSA